MLVDMRYTVLVILLLLLQYLYFLLRTGEARAKDGIKAPAIAGSERFERAYRVQINTLENLVLVLPLMVIVGGYFNDYAAATLGLVFFAGRALYSHSYRRDPGKRGIGFVMGFASIAILILGLMTELVLHVIAVA